MSALERSKLRLRQHVRHRLAAFWSKLVVPETATHDRTTGQVQEKCKMSRGADAIGEHVGCGALEALKLAQWQRLGKLEHTSHVLAAICEQISGQAATQNGTGCRKSAKC